LRVKLEFKYRLDGVMTGLQDLNWVE